jgi:hypothetical protein
MIEIFLKIISHQALDEWNERTVALFVLILVLDFLRRIFGRAQFRFELSNVARKWIEHKQERNGGTAVAVNPHPSLSVLLQEVVDELKEHRNENDECFRQIKNEIDEQFRKFRIEIRTEIRKEFEGELKVLRSRISELEM